ncbi:MAG: hypothetical protein Q9203_003664 [Teloschistes exilis]
MNQPNSTNSTPTGPRGESFVDANMRAWWRGPDSDIWRPAVFHSTIRRALINDAARQGSYTFPRKTGSWGPTDVTAYHPAQDWGLGRAHRPPKTFQFYRTRDTEPDYEVPIWIYRGHVVLDVHGQGVLDYKDLPATLSSREDGCFIEGMFREDPRIGWADFAARMPISHPPFVLDTVVTFQAMAMRQWRFRLQAACPSWTQRDASLNMQAQIERLVPRQFLAANSTRGWRDLTSAEINRVKAHGKKRPRKRRNRQGREQSDEEAGAQDQPTWAFDDDTAIYDQVLDAPDSDEFEHQAYYPMPNIAATEQHHGSLARRHRIPLRAPFRAPTHAPRSTHQHTALPDLPALPPHVPHSIARRFSQERLHPTPAVDFREVAPSNAAEQAIIDDALAYTLDHFLTLFQDLTGFRHGAITFPGHSYRDAYDQYVRLWEDAWIVRARVGEQMPVLRSVGPVGWCNKFPRVDWRQVRFNWWVCDEGYVLPPWHMSRSHPQAGEESFLASNE